MRVWHEHCEVAPRPIGVWSLNEAHAQTMVRGHIYISICAQHVAASRLGAPDCAVGYFSYNKLFRP